MAGTPTSPDDSPLPASAPGGEQDSAWNSRLSGAEEPFGFSVAPPLDLAAGTDLGGATIVRLLGEGGMGRIYEARQRAPDRMVAVKVMRDGIVSSALLRRFEYEAQLLARLKHPHIAQIYTLGTYRHGQATLPFFVMELIPEARPLTRYAAEEGLSIRQRVQLLCRVCAAVAHGHQKGVIHRDLKPGNILVDSTGEPKVIDFGVARSTDADAALQSQCTDAGQIVGTLLYMSPEQLDGAADEVDARADVYALGLVLHQLVAGRLPYDIRGKSLVEAARILHQRDHATCTAVEQTAKRDPAIGGFDARALGTIVAKCLELRPAQRYSTAAELAGDLSRWLEGEPILARPPGWLEAVARLARKYRAASMAAAVGLAALVVAIAGISFFYVRAEQQRRVAETARLVAEEKEREADRQASAARSQLYVSNVLLAAEALDRDNVAEAARILGEAEGLAAAAGTPCPVELDCLTAALDESIVVLTGHTDTVTATAWSPDGRRLATAAIDGSARIWSRPEDDGEECVVLSGHEGPIWSVAWSPDGRRVATASADRTVQVWDAASGRREMLLDGHTSGVYGVTFSNDGTRIATASRDKTARLWDAATGREVMKFSGHAGTVYAISLSPDGQRAVTASLDRTARLWDVATGEVLGTLTGHEARVFSAVFSPDGGKIATASEDGTARIWDVAALAALAVMRHPLRVNAVAFTADGRQIATASGDGVLRTWDVATGAQASRHRGHAKGIWSVSCSARRPRIATGSADATVRVWEADGASDPVLACGASVLSAAFAPDGARLATGDAESVVRLWDAKTLQPCGVLEQSSGRVNDLDFLADGGTIAAACDDGAVRFWDVASLKQVSLLQRHKRRIYSIDVAARAGLLATASEDRTAQVCRIGSGEPVCGPLQHEARVFCAQFSPDATALYTACEDRAARRWDLSSGTVTAVFEGHGGPVNWLDLSADGRLLATASSDGTVRIWDAGTTTCRHVLKGPARQVWKAVFSPDGHRVAGVSADAAVQLWETNTGRAAGMLRGHTDQVWAVAFAPDGRAIATGAWDDTVRLWGVSVADVFRARADTPKRVSP